MVRRRRSRSTRGSSSSVVPGEREEDSRVSNNNNNNNNVKSKSKVVSELVKGVRLAIDEDGDKRRRSWKKRVFYSWLLFWIFLAQLIFLKQLGSVLVVMITATLCYRELVSVMWEADKEALNPRFQWFYYYWFLLVTTYFYGQRLEEHLLKQSFEQVLGFKVSTIAIHFRSICFGGYLLGFVLFVISLRRRQMYRYQFERFGYCHLILFCVIVQSSFMLFLIFEGLIFFVLPSSLVVTNDVFAYIVGFNYGRTPLLPQLSPKKTVEGFIGGLFFTMIFSLAISRIFSYFPLMVCPQEGFQLNLSPHVPECPEMSSELYRPFPLYEYIPTSE